MKQILQYKSFSRVPGGLEKLVDATSNRMVRTHGLYAGNMENRLRLMRVQIIEDRPSVLMNISTTATLKHSTK